MNNKFFIKKLNKGFTLIETMVAILILSVALAALISLISGSLFISRYNKNEITVNYLLQEVIDYVKNDRDTKIFQEDQNWDSFLSKYKDAGCFSGLGCKIEVSSGNLSECKETGRDDLCDDILLYDENGKDNFYGYNNGGTQEAGFRRTIKMVNVEEDSLNITVTLRWKNGNSEKTRSLESTLMNWYQY